MKVGKGSRLLRVSESAKYINWHAGVVVNSGKVMTDIPLEGSKVSVENEGTAC